MNMTIHKNLSFAWPHQYSLKHSEVCCSSLQSLTFPLLFLRMKIYYQYFFCRIVLYLIRMQVSQAVNVAKQIEQDLQKHINNPKVSKEIINGTGFRSIDFGKDYVQCRLLKSNLKQFLNDYLHSIHIRKQIKKQLTQFCHILADVQKFKWKKFQSLYEDSNFRGSWIAVYYRQIANGECQFISHMMSCCFKLMPDVFILRTEEESGFLVFQNKKVRVIMVQRNRGFTRQDYLAVMNICSSMENAQYALK